RNTALRSIKSRITAQAAATIRSTSAPEERARGGLVTEPAGSVSPPWPGTTAETVLPRSGLRGDTRDDDARWRQLSRPVSFSFSAARLRSETRGEVSVERARQRVRGLVRVTTAVAVLVAVSLWAAAPVGAGDPIGEITAFTAGLTPH